MPTDDSTLAAPEAYGPEIAGVLVSRAQIASRVCQLARGITEAYDGSEVTILGTLTGSLVFLSDLIRLLPLRVRLDLVRVRSYPDTATTPREPELLLAPASDLKGKHVLIVDDILDTGRTLEFLRAHASSSGAASVRTCVLLVKRRDDLPSRPATDFVGFDIDDHFVVGYGLDYGDLYRNLPDICLLARFAGGSGR